MSFRASRQRTARLDRSGKEAFAQGTDLVSEFAQQKRATPAQIALAWILAQNSWMVPIPGTTKIHRLDENLGAINVQLTADDVRQLNEASANMDFQGERYPEHLLKLVGR